MLIAHFLKPCSRFRKVPLALWRPSKEGSAYCLAASLHSGLILLDVHCASSSSEEVWSLPHVAVE
jgi:hypothetical protein